MARHRHICRLVGSFVNIPRLPIAEALTAAAAVVYVVNMIVLRHTGCFKIEVPGFIDRVYQQVWPNWFSITVSFDLLLLGSPCPPLHNWVKAIGHALIQLLQVLSYYLPTAARVHLLLFSNR